MTTSADGCSDMNRKKARVTTSYGTSPVRLAMPREAGKRSLPDPLRSSYPSSCRPLRFVAVNTTTLARCDAAWGGRQPPHLSFINAVIRLEGQRQHIDLERTGADTEFGRNSSCILATKRQIKILGPGKYDVHIVEIDEDNLVSDPKHKEGTYKSITLMSPIRPCDTAASATVQAAI